MNPSPRRRAGMLLAAALLLLCAGTYPAGAASVSHAEIDGSGSSWAYNAIQVWISGVNAGGLKVVFTSTGSAQGRKDFGNATTDYGVSDIGYLGRDPKTGDNDLPCKLGGTTDCRKYAYLPIVAGGTSFPYHLTVAGQLVRNLRLSGLTLAKIFTGKITNWNDPAITKDNNGRRFPSIPIIPVNHAEGSGSSAQFTTYLDTEYPSIWRPYNGKAGETEYFPTPSNGIQQSGSDGVMNFITSAAANGAIGYDEYSYPLAKNYPVAKVENAAGYFTLPTQFNVAVALRQAEINLDRSSPNYLLQDLRKVYTFGDKRTYPLSSYSYMIIPTAAGDARMTTAKRQTLADFVSYSVCNGQSQVGPIGYSSLPLNLVKRSFQQIGLLKQADKNVVLTNSNVDKCDNPTFVKGNPNANRLAQIAPLPPACDKAGAGPCSGNGDSGVSGIPRSGGGGSSDGSGGSGGGSSGGSGSGTSGGSTGGGGGTSGSVSTTTRVNPDTGQLETLAAGGSTDGTSGSGDTVQGVPVDLAAAHPDDISGVLGPIAVLLIVLILALPPVLYLFVFRRRRAGQ